MAGGTGANYFITNDDARLSDARTPSAHGSQHFIGSVTKVASGNATPTTDGNGDFTIATGLASVIGFSCLVQESGSNPAGYLVTGISGGNVTVRAYTTSSGSGGGLASTAVTVRWVAAGT